MQQQQPPVLQAPGAATQYACESEIFCRGPLLDAIQRAQLFVDPKRFVDMPTRHPKEKVRPAPPRTATGWA